MAIVGLVIHWSRWWRARRSGRYADYGLDYEAPSCTVLFPESAEEISAICADPRYPSPVRATGAGLSLTRCAEAEGGTLLRMDRMKRIGEIRDGHIRVQAGVTFDELARHLEGTPWRIKASDIGAASIGSLACCHSKTPFPYAQVSQQITWMRVVHADGRIAEYSESRDPTQFALLRTSHGLLGVVTDVAYRLWPRVTYQCELDTLSTQDFVRRHLVSRDNRNDILFFVVYPAADKVTVETKREVALNAQAPQWYRKGVSFRSMGVCWGIAEATRIASLRWWLADRCTALSMWSTMQFRKLPLYLQAGKELLPIARHATPLSIRRIAVYSMPVDTAPQWFPHYLEFLRSHPETAHNYHPMYLINAPDPTHFALTRHQRDHMVVDACVGYGCDLARWHEISAGFDAFCARFGGIPLFNQSSNNLRRADLERAYGAETVERFEQARRAQDPHDRFLSRFFRELLRPEVQREATQALSPAMAR